MSNVEAKAQVRGSPPSLRRTALAPSGDFTLTICDALIPPQGPKLPRSR
jgi:hypothetical protein